ncbi:11616_t:CDS:2 [Gigaspora rosea]|nr:11616_t:CDS:2 [Gigaspora rosea]
MQRIFEKLNQLILLNVSETSKVKNIRTGLIDNLRSLKSLAHDVAYLKRIEFISVLSNSSNKRELLFGNVINTEEEINKRAKVLSTHFHPDKTNNTCSFELRGIYKSQCDALFIQILSFKEVLLNKLKSRCTSSLDDDVNDYEKYGNECWQNAIDYNNASKRDWNKLKVLKKDDLMKFSDQELKNKSIYMAGLAYQQYRAACKIADKNNSLKKQVKLRGYMALCQYFVKNSLTAQLYALAAINLQVQNRDDFTLQEINEAKKIFDKINGKNSEFKNAMVLIGTKDQMTYKDRRIIQNSINRDLEYMVAGLLVEADRSLVRYESSYKEILRAKRHAKMNMVKGGATILFGMLGCTGSLATNTLLVVGLSNPFFIVVGLACIGFGIYSGYSLFKEGKNMLKEPKIRERLNKIINKALIAYDGGKYQEFINALSEEYDENNHKSLITSSNKIKGIDNKVDKLKKHGFRSDGIAYLLVLLGEVLCSGKTKVSGTHADFKGQAKKCFEEALSDVLVVEAKKLDDCTSELRKASKGYYKISILKRAFGKVVDSIMSREDTRLALEYLEDSQEMPFSSRLEEIRNIARINVAILNITEYEGDTIEEATKMVKEIRRSIERNYHFVNRAESRLEVLEDFLWIISGENLPDESHKKFYYAKAIHLEHEAEKAAKINKLNSLRYWKLAQESYEKAREMDPENPNYSLGFARCLLNLSKYTQVIDLTDVCPVLDSLSKYWHFRSIAYLKHRKYKDAMTCNTEALRIDPKDNLVNKYRELIKKLDENDCVDNYKRELKYEQDYFKNSHGNECPKYNILSIDGGGIRGVLPALFLSEIEYRTHRPISHLFNMIAGTSTGGIIAAGLSAQQSTNLTDLRPIFSASELLNIYKNDLKKFFIKEWSLLNIDMFTNKDRYNLLEKYLNGRSFYDAHENPEANDTFVDALMATTAAPTFFLPYKIKNKGTFLDGGIYLNNPALMAYDEAIRYKVTNEKISVLSLGTGCYIPDPSMPNLPIISVQEDDIDRRMYGRLGNRYQRWQIFFEEPIKFDDYESIPNLLELGYQYIEELDFQMKIPLTS